MDTEYVLSCATELGELTPLEGACFTHIRAAYNVVRRHVDNNLELPHHFLQNTAREALAAQPLPVRHWVALEALSYFKPGMDCLRERASFDVQRHVQNALGVAERVHFSFEESEEPGLQHLFSRDEDVTESAVLGLLEHKLGGLKERIQEDVTAIQAAINWFQSDSGVGYRKVAASQQHVSAPVQAGDVVSLTALLRAQSHSDYLSRQRKAKVREAVSLRKQAHAAIKKATKLFTRMGQEENLRLLVSGKQVTLSHPDSPLKFVLQPLNQPGWLEKRTVNVMAHTPYDLSVLTKEDVMVSRICVYLDQTPVLDQLLALSLFIQAGDELALLKKANFFAFGAEEGKKTLLQRYPELESKFPAKQDLLEPGALDGVAQRTLSAMIRKSPAEVHWEPFAGPVKAWVHSWLSPVVAPLQAVCANSQMALACAVA